MKCPVCNTQLKFSIEELEEVYYDCSNCDSSLLFKNGEYEILNKASQSKLANLETLEEQETENQEPLEEEIPQPETTKQETLEEQEEQEEEFIPDETTQVPELNLSEQEQEQEQEEEQEQEQEEEQEQEQEQEEEQEQEQEQEEEQEQEQEQEEEQEQEQEQEEEQEQEQEQEEEQEQEQEQEQEEQEEEQEQQEEQDPTKEDFSEVAEFGNTQDQDRQGPFIYDLILKEINSKNVREKVLSILDDESLNLPFIKKNEVIKNGQLIIEKISPVQAYIIVTTLMGLPLQISWKQRHIADSPND